MLFSLSDKPDGPSLSLPGRIRHSCSSNENRFDSFHVILKVGRGFQTKGCWCCQRYKEIPQRPLPAFYKEMWIRCNGEGISQIKHTKYLIQANFFLKGVLHWAKTNPQNIKGESNRSTERGLVARLSHRRQRTILYPNKPSFRLIPPLSLPHAPLVVWSKGQLDRAGFPFPISLSAVLLLLDSQQKPHRKLPSWTRPATNDYLSFFPLIHYIFFD